MGVSRRACEELSPVPPVIPLPANASASAHTAVENLAELTRSMPTETRDALSWLAHLLDASIPLRASEDTDEFAHRHLYRSGGTGLISLHERLGQRSEPLVQRDETRATASVQVTVRELIGVLARTQGNARVEQVREPRQRVASLGRHRPGQLGEVLHCCMGTGRCISGQRDNWWHRTQLLTRATGHSHRLGARECRLA